MKKIDYQTYETPSDFYKVVEGVNVIKIISEGFMARKHGIRASGRWIPLGECIGLNCQHCKEGNEAKLTYIWIVLDRLSPRVRVLEVSKRLGDLITKQIKNHLAQEIDIEINRKGMDKNTKYTLSANPSKELTKIEEVAIEQNQQYLTKKYIL